MDIDTAIKRYFEIKQQIRLLQEKIKEIEPIVFERVFEENDNKLTTDYCRFQIVYRPKYKYSDKLLQAEKQAREKIKLAKKKEEIEGTAEKITDGGQLRMTDLKE